MNTDAEAEADASAALAGTPPVDAKGRSLWDDARRRLGRNPAAMTSLVILGVLALLALFGPMLWPHKVDAIYKDIPVHAPTMAGLHWFGTDAVGRDMVARVLFGLRISLAVGLTAALVSLLIGVAWGTIAGYVGGALDAVMMRTVDVIYTIPFIFLVIVLMTVIQDKDPFVKLLWMFVAIGSVEWLTMARIVRGQAAALRSREFVEAARASGATPLQIMARHIAPNLLGPVIVYTTLTVPLIILSESFLSFLGLGVQEPLTSLGRLIADGAKEMERAPWMLIFPGATMALTLLCLNFLGDGLRDALDPKER